MKLKQYISKIIIKFLLASHNKIYSYLGSFAILSEHGIHPKHRLTNYHKFFVDNVFPGEKVLDIGCGNGLLLKDIIKRTGSLGVGVDVSWENLKSAKSNLSGFEKAEIVHCDIWKYQDQRQFDVIILSNILEHLDKRSQFLEHIKKSFNPKKFLIRVPTFDRDWLVPYKKELGFEWRLDNTHKVEYTEEIFRKELEVAGLKPKELVFKWGEIYTVAVPI